MLLPPRPPLPLLLLLRCGGRCGTNQGEEARGETEREKRGEAEEGYDMICMECDCEEFVQKNDVEIEQEFRGETLTVKSPASVCSICGWITVTPKQADALRKLTVDAYRAKRNLLTSSEIKSIRERLAVNQLDFALLVGVGSASVKRWELGTVVQTKALDDLIRKLGCSHTL